MMKGFILSHSFHAKCFDDNILSFTNHIYNFPSIISNNKNVIGVQFHPEKSYDNGIKFLRKFIQLND